MLLTVCAGIRKVRSIDLHVRTIAADIEGMRRSRLPLLDENELIQTSEQYYVGIVRPVHQPRVGAIGTQISEGADFLARQHRLEQFRVFAARSERVRGGDESGVRAAVQRSTQLRRDRHRGVGAHAETALLLIDAHAKDADVAQLLPALAPRRIGCRRPFGRRAADAAPYRVPQLADVLGTGVAAVRRRQRTHLPCAGAGRGSRGNPSPRSAIVLRWISSVPPPIRRPGANSSRSTQGADT